MAPDPHAQPASAHLRPKYHFTPPANWMNDPNGLVYYQGEYHLFYQYHPESDLWGPMHWGHAVSHDLVHWEHLPVALYPDENGMIFSGSAVIDRMNTAGFGTDTMVSVFTHHKEDIQSQSIAYSHDAGRTWRKSELNPILFAPEGLRDFRDPKVFWYGVPEQGHWVMCLAARDRILFYTSPDLLHWTVSGQLGPGYGTTAGVWETPELFELRVDDTGETRWILTVGVQEGSPAGGSGTQYFVGTFDGQTFISENPKETTWWADFGADYYAAQSWNDEPTERRLMLGWMNNWDYARLIPSSNWRGTFTLIRELSLSRTEDGIRLVQNPIPEMQALRGKHEHWPGEIVQPNTNLLANIRGSSFEMVAEFKITQEVDAFGFHVRMGRGEQTTIKYEPKERKLLLDRTLSGSVDFHHGFGRVHAVDLAPINDLIRLHIFVDSSSVEVFANDGLITITDCIFPGDQSRGLELFVEGGNILLNSLDLFQLSSAKFKTMERG
jgi:fructan beta-fructosidase